MNFLSLLCRVEDCQIRIESAKVVFISRDEPALLHGIRANEHIGNRALLGSDVSTTQVIPLHPHEVHSSILS